jgi:hypothetical protein
MRATYPLKFTYKQAGIDSELNAEVISDTEGKVLRIIVTIRSELVKKNNSRLIKDYKGLRASVKFYDNDKPIDDIGIIMKDKRFWDLIRYYQKEIFDPTSRKQLLLNDTKIAQKPEENASQKTNLLPNLMRILLSISESKIKSNATTNILFLLKYILQKLNVCTSITVSNQEEITIANTYLGYRSITLFDKKFPSTLFYLHLANVMLANQLILKPVTDFIARLDRTISLLKRSALPISFGMTAVNAGFDAIFNTFWKILPGEPNWVTNLILSILPLLWPVLGFCLRRYASTIIFRILRYATNRILNSPNYKDSFMKIFEFDST